MKVSLTILLIIISFLAKSQEITFLEISDSIGLDYNFPGHHYQMAGGGLSVIDVNNDGWEDLIQSGGFFETKLWINNNGKFEDKTKEFGLDTLNDYFVQSIIPADYNNDGWEDFVLLNHGKGINAGDKKSPVLFKNIEGKYFETVDLSSLVEPGYYSSAVWGDINNDGLSDLYITNYLLSMGVAYDSLGREDGYDPVCQKNKLLINLGDDKFIESSEEYGVNDDGCSLGAMFSDLNNDGFQDLILLNDFGIWNNKANKIFINQNGESFIDQSEQLNFNEKMYGMGVARSNLFNTEDIFYYVTNIGENKVYKLTDDYGFEDVTSSLSISPKFVYDTIRNTSWSGLFFDANMNGYDDLFVSNGNVAVLFPPTAITDYNHFFENTGEEFIQYDNKSVIADGLSNRGAVIMDFDRDGDLDIVSSVAKMPWATFQKKDQKIKCYANTTINPGNYIAIKLEGGGDINKNCFGAKVVFKNGDQKKIKFVESSTGHASQSTSYIYYGLGNDEILDELTIIWPNGKKSIFEGLKSGKRYKVSYLKNKIEEEKLR